MHAPKSAGNMLWVILLLFVATFGFNACSDVNNVSGPPPPKPLSPDAKLSTLTVNPGTLDPVFSSDVANYTVDVATSVTSVTVTAQPQNAGATISINGQTTTSRSVTLGVAGSSTVITIVVTAVSGSQNTYIVTVNRAAPASDNNLSALSVTGQTLDPGFAPGTLNYTVDVATTVTSVNVSATKSDPTAVMSGSVTAGAGQATGQATIPLPGGPSSTPVSILMTAPNGSQKTYTITVNRAAPASNNNLSALSVTGQTLDPGFAPGTLNYMVDVATTVTSVNVSATKSDPTAVMSGSVTAGAGVATGQATIPLPGGPSSTPVSILMTAPNGNSKTYTIIVNRAAPANSNNNLSALVVSAGGLSPAFGAGILSYNVAVPNTTLTTTVTATVADSTATLTINGSAAISGVAFGPINLAVGANLIPIVVTAQDGTPKTYTVTVNRAAPLSGNNNLSALVVSAGALEPSFDADTTSYEVQAPILTPSTTVTATVADSTATLTINGSPATSGVPSGDISLAAGANPISIVVTAEDETPKTYTVIVRRLL